VFGIPSQPRRRFLLRIARTFRPNASITAETDDAILLQACWEIAEALEGGNRGTRLIAIVGVLDYEFGQPPPEMPDDFEINSITAPLLRDAIKTGQKWHALRRTALSNQVLGDFERACEG
jgi:hypothetical protein